MSFIGEHFRYLHKSRILINSAEETRGCACLLWHCARRGLIRLVQINIARARTDMTNFANYSSDSVLGIKTNFVSRFSARLTHRLRISFLTPRPPDSILFIIIFHFALADRLQVITIIYLDVQYDEMPATLVPKKSTPRRVDSTICTQ